MQCLVLWNGDNELDGRHRHKSSSQDELRPSFLEPATKVLRHRSAKQCFFAALTGLCIGEMFRNGKRGFLWNATTFGVKRSFGDTLCNLRGDLVPDACSSVPTGTVLADRRVAVLDVPSSHSLSQQVNLLGVGPQLPHTSNESPRSPWTAAAGLPLGRNISEKYGSESTLEVSGKGGGRGGLDSRDQYDYPANHTKSSQDPRPCCFLLSHLRASQLQQPLDVAAAYVCEYISINAALAATCCELRPDEEGFKLARHSRSRSLSPHNTTRKRCDICGMLRAPFDVQGNWVELMEINSVNLQLIVA